MLSDILDYAETYITNVNNRFRNNGNRYFLRCILKLKINLEYLCLKNMNLVLATVTSIKYEHKLLFHTTRYIYIYV